MKAQTHRCIVAMTLCAGLSIWILLPGTARAHCDTIGGPVLNDAAIALAKSDVTPVLKWIKHEHEAELRSAFARTLAVRAGGTAARELADQFFFETLVRLHRMGEGAPYTGLKPAGTDLGPAVTGSDNAIKKGSSNELTKLLADAVGVGIKSRFAEVMEAQKHAGDSVEAGRKYVAAYVEFVHYAERLYQDATGKAGHDESEKAEAHEHAH